jgi:hypothetical protein
MESVTKYGVQNLNNISQNFKVLYVNEGAGKGSCPCPYLESILGVEVKLHSFVTSVLNRMGGQLHTQAVLFS